MHWPPYQHPSFETFPDGEVVAMAEVEVVAVEVVDGVRVVVVFIGL